MTADDDKAAADRSAVAARPSADVRRFDVVLGPDYNAAHADHLHLDRGRGGGCAADEASLRQAPEPGATAVATFRAAAQGNGAP